MSPQAAALLASRLDEAARRRGAAIRTRSRAGWAELAWSELAAAASSARRAISDLDGVSRPGPDGRPGREGAPLVVAIDNSPECAATLLGAAIAEIGRAHV